MDVIPILPTRDPRLRVEQRDTGTAVTGSGFRVWDADHTAAMSWARQLARGLLGRQVRAQPRDSPAERRLQAVPEQRVPHILLAEDDADFRALLVGAFRSRGYEVTECVDGPDLVSKLGSYVLFGPPARFDLVVSDIRMPGATALEILEAMRECEGVPPVILITGFPSDDTQDAALQLGVAAVFDKPFEIEDLMATAELLLGV